jgi:hypothetical protein
LNYEPATCHFFRFYTDKTSLSAPEGLNQPSGWRPEGAFFPARLRGSRRGAVPVFPGLRLVCCREARPEANVPCPASHVRQARAAILHNTSYSGRSPDRREPEGDYNLYYVNIAWDGFQRGVGSQASGARNERASLAGKDPSVSRLISRCVQVYNCQLIGFHPG